MNIKYLEIKKASLCIVTVLLTVLCYNVNAQLKLYPTGSISIGSITIPPAGFELQVIGNSVYSGNTGAIKSSALIRGINIFSTDTNPDYTWWGNNHSGIFHPGLDTIGFAIAGKEAMRLSPSGNLLIGNTIDNGDKFQVTGVPNVNSFDIFSTASSNNIYSGVNWVNNTTTKAWAVEYGGADQFYVYGNGQAYAYGWNSLSDSTLKENIHGIQSALSKVLLLQGVTYNFKTYNKINSDGTELPGNRQMGLLAQAVERVVPEVVSTTSTGLKTIAYSNLVGLLIEAMKQEDLKVSALQHKLDSCVSLSARGIKPSTNDSLTNGVGQAKLYQCNVGENKYVECYIPVNSCNAEIMLFDMNGALKKTIQVNDKGKQNIDINSGKLSAGMYYYSLVINGKEIDTKKLIITR